MRRIFANAWVLTVLVILLAAVILARAVSGDSVDAVAVVFSVALVGFGVFTGISLLAGSQPDAGVDEHVERGGVVVFWRPGCTFCLRLMWTLRARLGDVYWVNIWKDDDAAARVRSINKGNETVPTLVTDTETFVATDRPRARALVEARAGRR
ncbi:glutaredoxin domain-containing protein [Zhihengliuella salsuginis]|uniref:Glutaredoxin domain-containing protein n=1 Tax=Zhihengliuella salsuginis TaxID=578222 RepID=A0ABQ3GK51_9MICC|nr:glutaredoxin domain-containing protein [Zhihengliuella salsuginis]GHD07935.1 hypothetical protein GCM10008096_19250 [Zhihengliuella salsuginis]